MANACVLFTHPCANDGWAQSTPPKDWTQQQVKEETLPIFQRPSNGRTTRLGRRVEKPGDCAAAGPSGQHDSTKHDCKHANK